MASPRHNVVFIKDHYKVKDPLTGIKKPADTSTLYIRSYQPKGDTPNRKLSLEIRLKNSEIKSFWDAKNQRFKDIKKNPSAQVWNDKIESELKKLGNYTELSNVPNKRKSFMKYWQNLIDTTTNHGTRIKHDVVKNKMQKFLGKEADLYFIEITPDIVRSIYHNFKTAKNPKRLTIATANHYMKMMHGVINTAKEERYYNYDVDPFVGLKFDKAEEPVLGGKVIDSRSMRDLLNDKKQYKAGSFPTDEHDAYIKPLPEYLEKYRLAWVYQLFSNGMRVGDMLTLKWADLDNKYMKYRMFKTKKSMIVPINLNLKAILCKVLDMQGIKNHTGTFIERLESTHNTAKASITIDNERISVIPNDIAKRINDISVELNIPSETLLKSLRSKGHIEIDGYLVQPDKLANYYILKSAREYIISYISGMDYILRDIADNNLMNDFVFPFLSKDGFTDVVGDVNAASISVEQYKRIKHATIVYNRNLKKIAKHYQLDEKVNLTSHVARHSFASYLLSMGNVNTFDIQKLLGHSSIAITDKYLQKHFNTEKLEDTNRRLSNENIMSF